MRFGFYFLLEYFFWLKVINFLKEVTTANSTSKYGFSSKAIDAFNLFICEVLISFLVRMFKRILFIGLGGAGQRHLRISLGYLERLAIHRNFLTNV